MAYQILVVDDEPALRMMVQEILTQAGYAVCLAGSCREALTQWAQIHPDAILLDVMLPDGDGFSLLGQLRQQGDVPVLFLSARDEDEARLRGLGLGADDYITKPFEPEEVLARIEAALRRVGKESTNDKPLTHRALTLSPSLRKATLAGQELALTAHEFDILELLMRQPEKVYTRESLYEQVWHGGYYGENNTVNVHVSNIRKKLKAIDPDADYIQTVYGIGFKLQ